MKTIILFTLCTIQIVNSDTSLKDIQVVKKSHHREVKSKVYCARDGYKTSALF